MEWSGGVSKRAASSKHSKPYFIVAGELTKATGIQTVIPLMKHIDNANLYVCGTGDNASELFEKAKDLKNVYFLGALSDSQRAELIANATAMIVPSLLQEPAGDRVLEAFSLATPAIVRNRGALPEYIARSGGGMLFENSAELLDKMHLLLRKPHIAKRMGSRGVREWRSYWSESNHVALYIDLIRSMQLKKDIQFV